jgi:hypothetical protein
LVTKINSLSVVGKYANFAAQQEFMSKQTVFIINRSEIAAGTRGASLGPEAIFTRRPQAKD